VGQLHYGNIVFSEGKPEAPPGRGHHSKTNDFCNWDPRPKLVKGARPKVTLGKLYALRGGYYA